ncbi:hypothetical protein [Candidatus Poriferisodalis sp.]|uniref:hypothetical protein n=1 Tax=Candidatus Poriferisodalis sp. TaxID=3101277 RepID=UPI003B0290BD
MDVPSDASLSGSDVSDEPWYRQAGPLFTESFADPQPGIASPPSESADPPLISFAPQAAEIPRIESAAAASAEWDLHAPESAGQLPLAESEDLSIPAPDEVADAVAATDDAATDDDAAWLPPSLHVDPPAGADEPPMGLGADEPDDEEVVGDADGQGVAAEPEGAAAYQATATATDLEAAPAAEAVAAGSRTASSEPPSIVPIRGYYLTRAHDTLRSVAAQFLNAPERWGELRSINAAQPGVGAAGADTLLAEGTAIALPGEPLVWGRPDPVYLWTLAETFLFTAWGREPTPEEVVPFWRGLAAGAAPDEAGPPQIGTDLPGIEARADLPSEFDLPPGEESDSPSDEPSEGHDSAVVDGEVVDGEPRTAVDSLDDDIADAEVVSVESRPVAEAEDADDGDVVGAETVDGGDVDDVAVLDADDVFGDVVDTEGADDAEDTEDADDGEVVGVGADDAFGDVVGGVAEDADVAGVEAAADSDVDDVAVLEVGGVADDAEDADDGEVVGVGVADGGDVDAVAVLDDVVGVEADSIETEFDVIVDERVIDLDETDVDDTSAADEPRVVAEEAEDDPPRASGVFAVRAVPEDEPAADAESEASADALEVSVGDAVEESVDGAAADAVEVFVEDAPQDVDYDEAIEVAVGEIADADTDWAAVEDESIAIAELDAAATPGDAHDDAAEPAHERDDGEIPSPLPPPMPSQADVVLPLSPDAPPVSPPDVQPQDAAALPPAPVAPFPPPLAPVAPPQVAAPPPPPPPPPPESPPQVVAPPPPPRPSAGIQAPPSYEDWYASSQAQAPDQSAPPESALGYPTAPPTPAAEPESAPQMPHFMPSVMGTPPAAQSQIPRTGLIGRSLAGTAIGDAMVLWSLGRRRRQGQRVASGADHIEQALRQTAGSEDLHLIETAMRHLRAVTLGQGRMPPAVLAVRVGTYGFEVLLASPAQAPPGWRSASDGYVLELPHGTTAHDLGAVGLGPSLCPALVPVGNTLEGPLLLNLEQIGCLAVSGPAAPAISLLGAITTALDSSPMAQEMRITAVGLDQTAGASQWERVRLVAHDSPEFQGVLAMASDRRNVGGIADVVVVGPGHDLQIQRISQTAMARDSGMAVVAATSAAGTRWPWSIHVDATATAVVHPISITMAAAQALPLDDPAVATSYLPPAGYDPSTMQ